MQAGFFDLPSLFGIVPVPVTPDQEHWVCVDQSVRLHVTENFQAGEYRDSSSGTQAGGGIQMPPGPEPGPAP